MPHLIAQKWGRIVNISSRAYLGNPGQANYAAAKAGILGLSRALAIEQGRYDITVNAVAPGFIATEMVKAQPHYDLIKERAWTCWRTASGSLPSGAKTRRPSDNCTGVIPSGGRNRSCSTAGVDDPPVLPPGSVTVASFAAFLPAKPNWTRQRNTMLVTMPWRRQTSATLMPGCSDSNTTASFSLSVKLRRFERPSCGGFASRAAVSRFPASTP
jgi:NAD(P)-dependent dehydrogenase (short-subunit alcohol dehydrogenase family)